MRATQNTEAASDSTQTAGRPLSTSEYVEAMGVLVRLNTSAQGSSTSRERKRTRSKELSNLGCASCVAWLLSAADRDQDHSFKKFRSALENELDILLNQNLKLKNEFCAKRDKNQELQAEFFQLSKRENLECKVCYRQEGKWTVLVCGHMFCWLCAENLEKPRQCPLCRADVMGYFVCYPFAWRTKSVSPVNSNTVFYRVGTGDGSVMHVRDSPGPAHCKGGICRCLDILLKPTEKYYIH